MQVEIKLDPSCEEPKVVILTNRITDDVNNLVRKLSDSAPQVLVGFKSDSAEILEQTSLYRVYSANGKIYAVTDGGEYTLRLRLYELEERLDKSSLSEFQIRRSST